jgi:hypothetical protein
METAGEAEMAVEISARGPKQVQDGGGLRTHKGPL